MGLAPKVNVWGREQASPSKGVGGKGKGKLFPRVKKCVKVQLMFK